MKRPMLLLALAAFATFAAFAGIEAASGAREAAPTMHEAPSPMAAGLEAAVDAPLDPKVVRLTMYLDLEVMQDWPTARIQSVDTTKLAFDIARASLRKPSADPAHDAVMLATLAYVEGARFAEYVDSMECNDPRWRAEGFDVGPAHKARKLIDERRPKVTWEQETTIWTSQELMHVGGDCDGKRAWTLWQIHPAEDPSSPFYEACKLAVIRADRSDAAFCALALVRLDGSLMAYTGGQPEKAEERARFAEDALRKHPFKDERL